MHRFIAMVLISLGFILAGCPQDKTAEEACKNADCPLGTIMELHGSSFTECSAAVNYELNFDSEEVGASGKCVTMGDCVYSCTPTKICCRNEKWELNDQTGSLAYSCEVSVPIGDKCECVPDCTDKECGPDGCGGLCGDEDGDGLFDVCPQYGCTVAGVCKKTCVTGGDCAANAACNLGDVCTFNAQDGSHCGDNDQACLSGNCEGGYCCATGFTCCRSDDQCPIASQECSSYTCVGSLAAGENCDADTNYPYNECRQGLQCACTDLAGENNPGAGACKGVDSGVCCDADASKCCQESQDCGPESYCKNDSNYSWACEDAVCTEQLGEPCVKYACNAEGMACGTSCTGPENCLAGHACANDACVVPAGVGESCGATEECGDGLTCQNEVCCLATSDATCCGLNAQCSSECNADAHAVYPGKCDAGAGGTYICGPDWGNSLQCAPFKCAEDGISCKESCAADTDCQGTSVCVAGACQSKSLNGQSCDSDGDCVSGTCDEGKAICCDSSDGTCCQNSADCPGTTCSDLGSGDAQYSYKCSEYACTLDIDSQKKCGAYVCNADATDCVEDGACQSSVDCAEGYGYLCDSDGKCKIPNGVGESCDLVPCKANLACDKELQICCPGGNCCQPGASAEEPGACADTICDEVLNATYQQICNINSYTCTDDLTTKNECLPYKCADATSCNTKCESDDDCLDDKVCVKGACQSQGLNGQSCDSDGDCVSGKCDEDKALCCNSKDGTCCANDGDCKDPICTDLGSGPATYEIVCTDYTCKKDKDSQIPCGKYNCNSGYTDCLTSCKEDSDCLAGYDYICEDVDSDGAAECIIPGTPGDSCNISAECKGSLTCDKKLNICCDSKDGNCCETKGDCPKALCTDSLGGGPTTYDFKCSGYVCKSDQDTKVTCGGYMCDGEKSCKSSCESTADCVSSFGYVCVENACNIPATLGQSCASVPCDTALDCDAEKEICCKGGDCCVPGAGDCPDAVCIDGISTAQTCNANTYSCANDATAKQICAPYKCDGTVCAGSCSADTDCKAGYGYVCSSAGVCLLSATVGESCAVAPCANGLACDAAKGLCCNGGDCCEPGAGDCASAVCNGGAATTQVCNPNTFTCVNDATTKQLCAPYKCAGTACATSCSADTDCKAGYGYVCSNAGVCQLPANVGQSCAVAPCATGLACDEEKEICCNGGDCCVPGGSDCDLASCVNDISSAQVCNPNTYTCTNDNTSKEVCSPYKCSTTSDGCSPSCSGNNDCQSPNVCVGNQCQALGSSGAACDQPQDCISGFCDKSICCNSDGNCCKNDGQCTGQSCGDLGFGPAVYKDKCIDNACETNLASPVPCGGYLCDGAGIACADSCVADTDCQPGYGYVCHNNECKIPNGAGGSCDGGPCKDGLACDPELKICCTGGNCCTAATVEADCTGEICTDLGSGPSMHEKICVDFTCTINADVGILCTPYACQSTTQCNGDCVDDTQCALAYGFICNGGKCTAPAVVGKDCENTEDCVAPLQCGNIGTSSKICCATGNCCSKTDDCTTAGTYFCSEGIKYSAVCGSTSMCTVQGSAIGDCGGLKCANANACKSSCSSDFDCVSGHHCSGNTCKPQYSNGHLCNSSIECQSGHCQNGYCCSGGQCCVDVAQDCTVDYCLVDVLQDFSCINNVCIKVEEFCGGSSNGNLGCKDGKCNTGCTLESDCQEGYGCDLTTCGSQGEGCICHKGLFKGTACAGDNACANYCMDGFCCDKGTTSSGLQINECCDSSDDCTFGGMANVNAGSIGEANSETCSNDIWCYQAFKADTTNEETVDFYLREMTLKMKWSSGGAAVDQNVPVGEGFCDGMGETIVEARVSILTNNASNEAGSVLATSTKWICSTTTSLTDQIITFSDHDSNKVKLEEDQTYWIKVTTKNGKLRWARSFDSTSYEATGLSTDAYRKVSPLFMLQALPHDLYFKDLKYSTRICNKAKQCVD